MEMQPRIMKSKIVSMAVVGLEPWVSGKLNEFWGSKDYIRLGHRGLVGIVM